MLQLGVGVELRACARIPTRPRKVQLFEIDELADLFQLFRFDDGPGKINTGDFDASGRQVDNVADRSACATDHDTSALTNHPFGGLAVGCRGLAKNSMTNQETGKR